MFTAERITRRNVVYPMKVNTPVAKGTIGTNSVNQVSNTQEQSHAAAPIDSQNVTGSPVAAAWPPVTQQGPHSSSVVEQKDGLAPGESEPTISIQNNAVVLQQQRLQQQSSSLATSALLVTSLQKQAPSCPNNHVEGPSGVPQNNIPQQTNILNLDTWFNLTKACKEAAEIPEKVYQLATDKDLFISQMIYLLGAHWCHQNKQTTEGVSSPSNSSDSTALTFGNTELTHSNGHSVLSKQEKLEEGLSNIEALFNAVKTRQRFLEDPQKTQPAAATNTTQKTSDTSFSWFNNFLFNNRFFSKSESPKESKTETVLETSKKFQTFYTSGKMDFQVLRWAVDTQLNTTFFQDLTSKVKQQFKSLIENASASIEELSYLEKKVAEISQELKTYEDRKNTSFRLLDATDQVLKVEDNVPLQPLQQKAQVLLLIKGMTALKEKNTQFNKGDISKIIKENPAEKRSTLCQQLNANTRFANNDYVVLNDKNEISNKDHYKKPSHLITRFFYSLSRRLSTTDYSGEYRKAMDEVRKSVSNDFGSQASQRFNIEFGSRYRSGRPLTFGALREFLDKEKGLANGKEYVLQASIGDNILQQEFEKTYPKTQNKDFPREHKKVLFTKFLVDHKDFIVVKKDQNSSGDASSLGKKDWWLWPSQPDIKKANRETLELSEPNIKELFETNTKGTALVFAAREAAFKREIVPFLKKEQYLTIDDITQVQSVVENLSQQTYDGMQGTVEALADILSGSSEAMTKATNIAHAAAGARAFGNANTVLQGVGNAASIGALLAALPEKYGIRLTVAGIFALYG